MKKILVIGDFCYDRFVSGKANRISPEAPCLILNEPISVSSNFGMAGNLYKNILSISGLDNVIFYRPKTETVKTRFVDSDSGYILLRVDENDETTKKASWEELKSTVLNLGDYDFILISDYGKGFITTEFLSDLITWKETANPTSILAIDTKADIEPNDKIDWSIFDFIKINEDCWNRVDKSPEFLHSCNFIVTLGSKGCKVFLGNYENSYEGYKTLDVKDVSGCGDTFFAAFIVNFSNENPDKTFISKVENSCKYANYVASLAASKAGVVAIDKKEIDICQIKEYN